MPITDKTLSIMLQLEDRWKFYRSLHGNKWPERVKKYEKYIRQRMQADNCDILPAAISLGTMLSAAGKDPNELFAAAVELLHNGKVKNEHED